MTPLIDSQRAAFDGFSGDGEVAIGLAGFITQAGELKVERVILWEGEISEESPELVLVSEVFELMENFP